MNSEYDNLVHLLTAALEQAKKLRPEGDASALLRAVKVSEFSGISCQDVNGRNWFDARDEYLSR